MQKKRCRIYTGLPITCFEVPIVGETELNLTADEIYKCLCAKAEVIEILSDGSHINLDFTNYNKDNKKEEPILKATTEPIAVPFIGDTPEPIPAVIEEPKEVKEKVEAEEEVVLKVEDQVGIQEEIKEAEDEIETKEESTVEEIVKTSPAPVKATTVAEYQVASRNNNNNYKKAKNKK